jgi:hypothetical protein
MRFAGIVGMVVGLVASGCATPGAGARLTEANPSIQNQVEFDHQCPPEKVRIIRSATRGTTVDLDICGVVRRYKAFGTGNPGDAVTWLDVTNAYPASTLPVPLPAAAGKGATDARTPAATGAASP